MTQNRGRRGHYLLQAEEAEELAGLFLDESAREKWLNIAQAYRLLAGVPQSDSRSADGTARIRKSAA